MSRHRFSARASQGTIPASLSIAARISMAAGSIRRPESVRGSDITGKKPCVSAGLFFHGRAICATGICRPPFYWRVISGISAGNKKPAENKKKRKRPPAPELSFKTNILYETPCVLITGPSIFAKPFMKYPLTAKKRQVKTSEEMASHGFHSKPTFYMKTPAFHSQGF